MGVACSDDDGNTIAFKEPLDFLRDEADGELADIVPGPGALFLDGERLQQGQHVLGPKLGDFGGEGFIAQALRQHDDGLHLDFEQGLVLGAGHVLVGDIGGHALDGEDIGFDRPCRMGHGQAKHDHRGQKYQPQSVSDHAVNRSISSGDELPSRFIQSPLGL